jgi:hypothetical protein
MAANTVAFHSRVRTAHRLPKLPQQPAKSETNKSQFKMTQRRKKAISKRPKEERKKVLAMLEKKGRRTENH